MTSYVYVLQLINNKFYVGRTDDIVKRIGQHFLSQGAVWTKINKPISVVSYEIEKDDWYENYKTLQLMKIHGIKNVRGGEWCMIELNNQCINKIDLYINRLDDLKSYEENKLLLHSREEIESIEFFIEKLNIHGIDSHKYEKDLKIWTRFLLLGKCATCKEYKEVKYMKPHCYVCWLKCKTK